jgi:hypothetical protein
MFNTFDLNTYLHEIEWVNTIELEKENMIIRCMLVACCFDKARKRHLEYIKNLRKKQMDLYQRIKHAAEGEKE